MTERIAMTTEKILQRLLRNARKGAASAQTMGKNVAKDRDRKAFWEGSASAFSDVADDIAGELAKLRNGGGR